jgi:TRAP-type transport system small permease protein
MRETVVQGVVRLYDGLIALCGMSTAVAALLLTFGITINIAVRTLGLGSLDWVLEASEYALLIITFLGAPWALRRGAHVRVDVVISQLPPPVARVFEILSELLGLTTSLALFIWGAQTTLLSVRSHSMIYKVLIFPEWWLYALTTLSGLLLSIEFMRRLIPSWRGAPKNASAVDML